MKIKSVMIIYWSQILIELNSININNDQTLKYLEMLGKNKCGMCKKLKHRTPQIICKYNNKNKLNNITNKEEMISHKNTK